MRWRKVTLVGVGLLGGSLGIALRERKLAAQVSGLVRRASSIKECEEAGAVDLATQDPVAALAGAELVVLCIPVGQMENLSKEIARHIRPGTVVTDVGSVKDRLVQRLERIFCAAGAHFIGSHPMAGAEKMGVSAARAGLYQGAICVITPTRGSNKTAVRRVERLWKSIGSRVLPLSPGEHDMLVSRSSHLPHLVAAALVNYVLAPQHSKAQALLCANGFRDSTRVASGSPEMWKDIALANGKNISRALRGYIQRLRELDRLLNSGREAELKRFFEEGKRRRDAWVSQGAV